MAARFGRSLVDHRTWVVAAEGDLMEGVSHEAASLAGHLRLGRLTVLYDRNCMSVDGPVSLASSEDPLRRFAAYGWAVKEVDGHDPAADRRGALLRGALGQADADRLPHHPRLRRADQGRQRRRCTGCRSGPARRSARRRRWAGTCCPSSCRRRSARHWRAVGERGVHGARRAWLKRLARHASRAEFERVIAGRLPESWHEPLAALNPELAETPPGDAHAGGELRRARALAPALPELCGGAADRAERLPHLRPRPRPRGARAPMAGRTSTSARASTAWPPASTAWRCMAGCCRSAPPSSPSPTAMRPALRLAALMGQRVIHLATHDGFGLAEDGAACQPVEQLAALRAMPGLFVFRPADAVETVECWELALRRTEGPSLLALTRQERAAAARRCRREPRGARRLRARGHGPAAPGHADRLGLGGGARLGRPRAARGGEHPRRRGLAALLGALRPAGRSLSRRRARRRARASASRRPAASAGSAGSARRASSSACRASARRRARRSLPPFRHHAGSHRVGRAQAARINSGRRQQQWP